MILHKIIIRKELFNQLNDIEIGRRIQITGFMQDIKRMEKSRQKKEYVVFAKSIKILYEKQNNVIDITKDNRFIAAKCIKYIDIYDNLKI